MTTQSEFEIRILSTRNTISALILGELKANVYSTGSAYIKFLLLPTVIEYLGACLDTFPFNEDGHSEKRFNKALVKLFPNKYHGFAKEGSEFYLYEGFRCNMVHRLIPKGFSFTTRDESKVDKTVHLKEDNFKNGTIVLVLEDFFDDIEKAAKKLLNLYDQGKAPKAKGDENQLKITGLK